MRLVGRVARWNWVGERRRVGVSSGEGGIWAEEEEVTLKRT